MSNRFLPVKIRIVRGLGYDQRLENIPNMSAALLVFDRQQCNDTLEMVVKFGMPTYDNPINATANIKVDGGHYSDLATILRYLADQLERQEDRPAQPGGLYDGLLDGVDRDFRVESDDAPEE